MGHFFLDRRYIYQWTRLLGHIVESIYWAVSDVVQVDEPVTSDEEGASEPAARSNSKHLIEVKALNGQS